MTRSSVSSPRRPRGPRDSLSLTGKDLTMKSKCPILALAALGLLAPPARAGQVYYAVGVPGGSNIYRVPDDGGAAPTQVLPTLNVFAVGSLTNRPHAQAGGYAVLAARKDGEVTIGGRAYA